MAINADQIEQIIKEVVSSLANSDSPKKDSCTSKAVLDGIFPTMDEAVKAADKAWKQYLECTLAQRRRYIQAIRDCCLNEENLRYMAAAAAEESGMGNPEHKYLKNTYAARDTPGVEDLITDAWTGDDGMTTVEYSPYGVIGAICPTTNPTETIINNAIGMLAAGNTVVFSPHPRAKNVSLWLIRKINEALAQVEAPKNLVVTVSEPSIDNTNAMMKAPEVRMLVATGGPGIVRTVLSSGKKAIGAGAGNPPVVVDQTADIAKAARDIVNGASFDNNLPCTAEKEIIAVDSIADLLMFNLKKHGAFELKEQKQIDALVDLVVNKEKHSPKTEWVGKPALEMLKAIGVDAPSDTRLIVLHADKQHPFVQIELMMPILGLVRVADVDEAIDFACEVEHGNRHTAIMHSSDVHNLTRMGKRIQTTIFVKNGPSYNGIGIGGEGFPTFTIAGPTGEGLTSARSFARRRRCVMVGEFNIR